MVLFKNLKLKIIIILLLIFMAPGCGLNKEPVLSIVNGLDIVRIDEPVLIKPDLIHGFQKEFDNKQFNVLVNNDPVPFQLVDDGFVIVQDFRPHERKTVRIIAGKTSPVAPVQRVQAELSVKQGGFFENQKYIGGSFANVNRLDVPAEHTDHSYFIRYEGPGWESEKVGYRFYLDWRNAIDIFGKKKPDLILQDVGQDGFDSYHEMSDWGMDILKVGESLGLGSIAILSASGINRVDSTEGITCKISENGPLLAEIRTDYKNWTVDGNQFDLSSELSITAGSRLTRHVVTVTPVSDNLVTGIGKHEDAQLLKFLPKGSEWGCIGTFGRQSLSNDNLGMAVFFRQDALIQIDSDSINDYVMIQPDDQGQAIYYFAAAWQKEPGGIQDYAGFTKYLNETIALLNRPVEIVY